MASRIEFGNAAAGMIASGMVALAGVTNATSALGLDHMGFHSGIAMGVGAAGMAVFGGLAMVQ
ncbi:MAG: hypothetical protein ABIF01_01620 [Candidatus Micrarchaeota archaeon]